MSADKITISYLDSAEYNKIYPFMEMIARDSNGKMLCPMLKFDINGLDQEKTYDIQLSLERFTHIKYQFDMEVKKWIFNKSKVPAHEYKKISKGTRTGVEWMEAPIAFAEVRISNRKELEEKKNMLYVTPLHKYAPVLHITDTANPDSVMRFPVEAAQFIAVTRYYNPAVAALKCSTNKFTTARNGGKGEPIKRKAKDDGPDGKRTPMIQSMSPANSVDSSSSTMSSSSSASSTPSPMTYDYSSQFVNDYSNHQMNHYDPMFNQFDFNAQVNHNYPMPVNFPPVPPMPDFNSFNPMPFNPSTSWSPVNPIQQYPAFPNENFYPAAAGSSNDFTDFNYNFPY